MVVCCCGWSGVLFLLLSPDLPGDAGADRGGEKGGGVEATSEKDFERGLETVVVVQMGRGRF